MKHITCVIVVVLVLAGRTSWAARKVSEEGRAAVTNCKTQESASDEDLKPLMRGQTPSTTPAKCFLACMMEKTNLIKDGKYNTQHATKMAEATLKNRRTQLQSSKKKINACASKTQAVTDRCELAAGLAQCMKSSS